MIKMLLEWFLPQQCLLCDRVGIENPVCEACLHAIKPQPKILTLSPVLSVESCFEYHHGLQKLLHLYKFEKHTQLAPLFVQKLKETVDFSAQKYDLCIPVPAHENRIHSRGFYPVELLFKGFFLDVYSPCVQRCKDTPYLFELSALERSRLLKGAFRLHAGTSVQGKSIVVVDDIVTTGATLASMSELLYCEGARKVSALTLAYTQLKHMVENHP